MLNATCLRPRSAPLSSDSISPSNKSLWWTDFLTHGFLSLGTPRGKGKWFFKAKQPLTGRETFLSQSPCPWSRSPSTQLGALWDFLLSSSSSTGTQRILRWLLGFRPWSFFVDSKQEIQAKSIHQPPDPETAEATTKLAFTGPFCKHGQSRIEKNKTKHVYVCLLFLLRSFNGHLITYSFPQEVTNFSGCIQTQPMYLVFAEHGELGAFLCLSSWRPLDLRPGGVHGRASSFSYSPKQVA